jgi:hypothetical protein
MSCASVFERLAKTLDGLRVSNCGRGGVRAGISGKALTTSRGGYCLNRGRSTCFGVLGAVCSASSANRSHIRAISIKINRTRWLCSRSAICRQSMARSLHSSTVTMLFPRYNHALLSCYDDLVEVITERQVTLKRCVLFRPHEVPGGTKPARALAGCRSLESLRTPWFEVLSLALSGALFFCREV